MFNRRIYNFMEDCGSAVGFLADVLSVFIVLFLLLCLGSWFYIKDLKSELKLLRSFYKHENFKLNDVVYFVKGDASVNEGVICSFVITNMGVFANIKTKADDHVCTLLSNVFKNFDEAVEARHLKIPDAKIPYLLGFD